MLRPPMETRVITPEFVPHPDTKEAVSESIRLLQAGEVVALPTETVYGLAADALNPAAVAKIFEAKERPTFDPLIVHLPHKKDLAMVADVPPDINAVFAPAGLDKYPATPQRIRKIPNPTNHRPQNLMPDILSRASDSTQGGSRCPHRDNPRTYRAGTARSTLLSFPLRYLLFKTPTPTSPPKDHPPSPDWLSPWKASSPAP